MADSAITLTATAVNDASVTTVAVNDLQNLLHIQSELRASAERKWKHAQRSLVGILETFAVEEVERRLRAGHPLDSLPVEDLVNLVSEQLSLRLQKAQEKERQESQVGKDIGKLAKNYERVCQDLQVERENGRQLQTDVENLRQECERLKNQLAALQQVQVSHDRNGAAVALENRESLAFGDPLREPLEEPGWMSNWRKAFTFERDSAVLVLIGETGLARRPQIAEKAAAALGLQKPGGSISAIFQRLLEADLLEKYQFWKDNGAKNGGGAGSGGRHPDLLCLTEKGKMAYWLLAGRQPVTDEMQALLARHVTPEHTLLNLQAADVLQEAGYLVEMEPPDITLPDGGRFKPDLLLQDADGKLLFVEVETDTQKNREQRKLKWHNFYQASGGCLYVVCDNRKCMKSMISEINLAVGTWPGTVHLTNLADLKTGQRGEDGSIWLQVRKRV